MVTCAVCGKIRLEGQYTRTPLGKPVCNEKYINDCNPEPKAPEPASHP